MASRRFHVLAIATAVAASLALSACGGTKTVSAKTYARTVCSSVQTWKQHIQTRTDRMTQSLGSGLSPEKGKATLATYLDGILDETDQVISDLNGTGVPDVDRGQEVASKFVGAFERVRATLRSARAAVDRLPTGNQAAFKAAAGQIGTDIQTSFGAVGSSLSGVGGSELDAAFTAEKSCKG
jgi:hypothetical protein